MLLELDHKRILFDTGQGNSLFINAEKLDIALTDLDILVLSHGHYDHGGNVAKIFEMNPSINFYAHPDCLTTRYSYHQGKPPKYAGLSEENRNAITDLPPEQRHWCLEKTEIIEGVFITGTVPRENKIEDTGGSFYLDKEKKVVDHILDDISLWIEENNQLTVLCGCCHSGLQNTVEHILSFYKQPIQIKRVIGGLHLIRAGQERIDSTISFIRKNGIRNLIGSHCSGEQSMDYIMKQMKEIVSSGYAGLTVPL